MDRRQLTLAGCGLLLLWSAPGCQQTRSAVPPKSVYSSDGRGGAPTVGFSSEPHPGVANGGSYMPPAGMTPGMPGSAPGGMMMPQTGPGQIGTPGTTSSMLGAPTTNNYGPPGSTGVPGAAGAYTDPLTTKAAANASSMPGMSGALPAAPQ